MSLDPEPKSEWTERADRLLTWGMVIAIPLIGILGFGMLTSVKHTPVKAPPKGQERVLAAPEIDSPRPSVELKHAPLPRCPQSATPANGSAPCAAATVGTRPEGASIH